MAIIKNILVILIFILCVSCSTDYYNYNTMKIEYNDGRSEVVLQRYLKARSTGLFQECKAFLSDDYLRQFKEQYGIDYVDYFRNHNEDYYKYSVIIKKTVKENRMVKLMVSTLVEGPGYKSQAIESFLLNNQNGEWKITDWEIEYQN